MSEVQKFDPSTLMQGVKDRIKATFVSLIPDDQWDQMVKKEVDDFFKSIDTSYNSKNYRSAFGDVVRGELEKYVKEKISETLKHPDFDTLWTNNGYNVSEDIKTRLINAAPQIFAATIENAMSTVIMNLKNRGY
jgi:hypothetical protein